jgi:hypothetical protein
VTVHAIARRGLLKGAGAALGGAALAGPLGALFARNAAAATSLGSSPYGPVYPTRDLATGLELLKLPRGFTYRSMGWTGDLMANGQPTPGRHDGMGCVAVGSGRNQQLILIRNHELGLDAGAGIIDAAGKYDTDVFGASGLKVGGGNTNLVLRRGGAGLVSTQPSLGGTIRNCAGGTTPWGSWLSCEETLEVNSNGPVDHGYVFEVTTNPALTSGRPIREMGRFSHEAAAIDPRTGYVFETEDARNEAGFYRFVPTDTSPRAGALAQGGKLYAARVVGEANASLLTPRVGDTHVLDWVEVEEPASAPVQITLDGAPNTVSGPFAQAWAKGALRMSRGEGIWYSPIDKRMYIVDTSAGVDAAGRPGRGEGAVWAFDPATNRLTCIFASLAGVAANNPDNITVSPRGGIVLCEDGGGVSDAFGFGERLLGLNADGSTYVLAKNNVQLTADDIRRAGKSPTFVREGDYRGAEWCGACFDPTGRILFANVYSPGFTVAISGPWAAGNL